MCVVKLMMVVCGWENLNVFCNFESLFQKLSCHEVGVRGLDVVLDVCVCLVWIWVKMIIRLGRQDSCLLSKIQFSVGYESLNWNVMKGVKRGSSWWEYQIFAVFFFCSPEHMLAVCLNNTEFSRLFQPFSAFSFYFWFVRPPQLKLLSEYMNSERPATFPFKCYLYIFGCLCVVPADESESLWKWFNIPRRESEKKVRNFCIWKQFFLLLFSRLAEKLSLENIFSKIRKNIHTLSYRNLHGISEKLSSKRLSSVLHAR